MVINNNIDFGPVDRGSLQLDNHFASIDQSSEPTSSFGDETGAGFFYDGSDLTLVTMLLDEGSSWYVVNPGDVFGFSTIASGQFTEIPFGISTFIGTGDIYLGVSTYIEGIHNDFCFGPSCRDVFGWVRLSGTLIPGNPDLGVEPTGRLEMIENAVAYDSRGIIVGTSSIIPEPAGLALLWLAMGMLRLSRCGL